MSTSTRGRVRERIMTEARPELSPNELMDRAAATMLPIELRGRACMLEAHAFQSADGVEQLIVLVNRTEATQATTIPLVRIHSGCVTGDIFHSLRCDCHQQLQTALQMIADAPHGALVYIPYHEGRESVCSKNSRRMRFKIRDWIPLMQIWQSAHRWTREIILSRAVPCLTWE